MSVPTTTFFKPLSGLWHRTVRRDRAYFKCGVKEARLKPLKINERLGPKKKKVQVPNLTPLFCRDTPVLDL